MLVYGFIFSYLSDYILKRNYIRKSTLRYSAAAVSLGLQGIAVAALGYTTESWILCITILTIGTGFISATYMGHLGAVYDIAPTYAGTVYGFVNMAGNTSGFITPIVAAAFTEYDPHDVAGWRNLFWTSCGLYLAGFVIFPAFVRLTPARFEIEKENNSEDIKSGVI